MGAGNPAAGDGQGRRQAGAALIALAGSFAVAAPAERRRAPGRPGPTAFAMDELGDDLSMAALRFTGARRGARFSRSAPDAAVRLG